MIFELGKEEFEKIADILAGIGHVCLGSVAIPFLIGSYDIRFAVIGFVLACGSWVSSVYLVNKAKYYGT